jgi:hypothetical protein
VAKNKDTIPSPRPSGTLRVTFTYEGDRVQVANVQRIDMIAPPAVTAPPEPDQTGFWFEVRDSKGQLLHHQVLHNPIRTDVEVFSDEPGRSMYRVPSKQVKGEFTLLVPDLPQANLLVLHGPAPMTRAELAARSGEIVRYSFDELRQIPNAGRGGKTH